MQRLGRQAIVSCASYVRAKVDKLFTAGMSMTTTNMIPVLIKANGSLWSGVKGSDNASSHHKAPGEATSAMSYW